MNGNIVFITFGCGMAVVLAAVSGCAPAVEARALAMQESAEAGDVRSVEGLIAGFQDESEQVRQEAHRGLESVLKRKIYFDPDAPADERARSLERVRAIWQNLKDRDLVEYSKERMPIGYFYDLNTGELFEDRAGAGPVETPSGDYRGMPAGVRAVVFGCRDCGDDRYVAWLEVPNTELEHYGIPLVAQGANAAPGKLAIRASNGDEWFLHGTPGAEAITTAARRCDDQPFPLVCRPGR